MKRKFSKILGVGLTLALLASLLVTAVPVAASHDSSATVAFHAGESQLVGETSALDVEVTNVAGSLGKINKVKIDFSATDFTGIGKGVEPTNWTGVVDGSVITYTAAAGAEIAADDSLTFYPTVINPLTTDPVTNPTVTTTDPGTRGTLTTGAGAYEISYVADDVGDGITVEYLTPLEASSLEVSVIGKAISVTLETADAGTTSLSTATQVVTAINTHTAAKLLVDASTPDGSGIVLAIGSTPLTGGSDPDVDKACPVTGTLTIKEFVVLAGPTVPTLNTSATPTKYTVSFTTLTEIAVTTGTITITFPSGYDISLLVAGDITVKVAGVDYDPSDIDIDAVARTVTITAGAAIAVNKAVVVTTANDHVKNPPTSGTYPIAVLTSGPDAGSGDAIIIPAAFGVEAGVGNTVTAGTAFAVTVTALNADDGSDTGYAGYHFIDFEQIGGTAGTIPSFERFSFANGVGTSPSNFILTVAGEDDVTIKATDEDDVTGTGDPITINPAGLAFLEIGGEADVVAGVAFASDITVTAYDAETGGNVKTDYVGTVTWTSTDTSALLPADYTFTETDAGIHVFLATDSEFTLKTVGAVDGKQTITVADGEIKAESGDIVVTAALATELEVAADAAVLRANGSDLSVVTVTALDDFGNTDKTYSESITIESSLAAIASASPVFSQGEATTTLTSILDEVGTATIRVTGEFDTVTANVKLLPLIGIDTIDVTVDKSTILNNDVDVRTITATYKDGADTITAADGDDYTVTFTTDADPLEVTLNPADGVVVPENGVATVTLTTTLALPDTITVTATGIGGLTDNSSAITVGEGTFEITLYQGWNLISLPLIPTDPDIDAVLADLITADTVIQVRTYNASSRTWSIWASTGPYALNPTLTEMDDGLGFWVEMSATGTTLAVTGCVLPAPPETPPTYSVYTGWNMIGFTSLDTATDASVYLGTAVTGTLEVMYGYVAATGVYEPVVPITTDLTPGQGYWLAVNANGTIYP